jgi:hypothetical protein
MYLRTRYSATNFQTFKDAIVVATTQGLSQAKVCASSLKLPQSYADGIEVAGALNSGQVIHTSTTTFALASKKLA